MRPVSSTNSNRKRVFWDERNFASGHFCPQSHHLDRLAHKIGELWFSTKIQTENVIFGKTNSGGLLSRFEQCFRLEQFCPRTHHISFRLGAKVSRREQLCSILPQKPSRIRFSKKHVFGLNFCTKSLLTYFMGQTV